jgi:hypothetical protein
LREHGKLQVAGALSRLVPTVAAVLALGALTVVPASAANPVVRFTIVAKTPLKLTDIVWSGTRFFYVDNTTNRVFEADRTGKLVGLFSTMPNVVEETRCVVSPGARYGFPKGGLFCHSPDNRIYRIAPDGTATVFATIPESRISDGALAADSVGKFGHRLVAATGASGKDGGSVYTIDTAGTVDKVGDYPGPGGAENAVVAPSSFGSQAGSVLLSLDKDGSRGSVVAVAANGKATTIAELPDGANPIAVIPSRLRRTGLPRAGFYVVDTFPGTPLVAAARQFAGHEGHVIVGSELHGLMWIVAPDGPRFRTTRLKTNLTAEKYNLEGATFVP